MRIVPIPGFPGYAAREDGQILSWRRPGGDGGGIKDTSRVLKVSRTHRGYLRLIVYKDRKPVNMYVHILILIAFHGQKPDGMQSRHLNGDQLCNRPDNLCWGTKLENEHDRRRHGTIPRGAKQHSAKLTDAKVIEIRRRLAAGEYGNRLATEYGISPSSMSAIRLRQTWTHLS